MRFDSIVVGGGLSGSLLYWRLREADANHRILLIEKGQKLGGNHTWSFHGPDLNPAQHAWMKPFVASSWKSQDVRFPLHSRRLDVSYHSVTSEKLHSTIMTKYSDFVVLDQSVAQISNDAVTLANGQRFEADLIFDARGPQKTLKNAFAYQKFIGLDIELENPHGLEAPMIMDATIPQIDGYRFFYLLPHDEKTLLVEDTYYSDRPNLDDRNIEMEIQKYIFARGWKLKNIKRHERGVLPIPLTEDSLRELKGDLHHAIPWGTRANGFHPVTGYSLPSAIRLIDQVMLLPKITKEACLKLINRFAASHLRRDRFYLRLNQLLFWAAEPSSRYKVLERFYRLDTATIERFYSRKTTMMDECRILIGKPPVPLMRAAKVWLRGLNQEGRGYYAAN